MRFSLVAGWAALGCTDYTLGDDRTVPAPAPTTLPPVEPIADAGGDFEAEPLDELTLDAEASYDPEGLSIVAAHWTMVSAPPGSRAELSSRDALEVTLFVDLAGEYVIDLTVQNEDGVWDSTPDRTVVTAMPADGFYVELSWDADNDLDLHLVNGPSAMFGDGDCSYCNKTPSWGEPGTQDDPSLDWDVIFGYGPETITIDDPGAGVFHAKVQYYGESGFDRCEGPCAEALATVSVYLAGELQATFERLLSQQGDLWHVADIHGATGRIERVDELGTLERTTCR